VLNIKLEIFI